MVLSKVKPLYRAVCLALAFPSNLILAYCPKLCNRENGLQPKPCEPLNESPINVNLHMSWYCVVLQSNNKGRRKGGIVEGFDFARLHYLCGN